MDKFGIFNLLSSLLSGNNPDSDNKASGDLADGKGFFDSAADKKAINARAIFPPLQNSMLATMKTHDEFIKRVKAKQLKQ